MAYFLPDWWHRGGKQMRVEKFGPRKRSLKIGNSATWLEITAFHTEDRGNLWEIEWDILQPFYFDSHAGSRGKITFNNDQLAVAFGLKPAEIPAHSRLLTKRYGGDRAFRGKFFAVSNYLNIPMPGTGMNGDPNISIEITREIRDAVAQLMEQVSS